MSKPRFNHRHVYSWLVLAGLVLWSVFICYNSYIRLWESLICFGTSLWYALFFIYDWCPFPWRVNELSSAQVKGFLPSDFESYGKNIEMYFDTFFDKYNFLEFLLEYNSVTLLITRLLLIGVLIGVCVFAVKKLRRPPQNNNTGKTTAPLDKFRSFEFKILRPAADYVKGVFAFFTERKYYVIPSVVIVFLSTNIISIFFAVFAYYCYILPSLDFLSFAIQLYKLSVDIVIMLSSLPIGIWLLIALIIFDYLCKCKGYARLERRERVNQLFLRTRGLNIFVNGPPRFGKTSLSTDMQLSQAVIFREDSLAIMLDVSSCFPHFSYQTFTKWLDKGFSSNRIKSRAYIERYIKAHRKKFMSDPTPENLWGYDFEHYPLTFDNGLVVEDLFEALSDYAAAYYVYTRVTLFISNYPIRECATYSTVGNIGVWNHDFFHRPSYAGGGEFSYIINYDAMRPGKKMKPEEALYGLYEFFINGNQEIDKERGNTVENQELKASDEECNPKNDQHERHLMMQGHASMIRHKCFYRGFYDSQRATGWGAKGNELTDHVDIIDKSDKKIALPFWWYRELLKDLIKGFFNSKTVKNWLYRGDYTLGKYLVDVICSKYLAYCKRIENTFGFSVYELEVARGDGKSDPKRYKWYMADKKIFSGVYATDSFKEYFAYYNLKTSAALQDQKRFTGLRAPLPLMKRYMNSHMVDTFTKDMEDN
ncbi:MAG: hypothetical protein IJY01_03800 [Clostridia bacterium]|nr:hypothetical protein [Clostridia bacterium]